MKQFGSREAVDALTIVSEAVVEARASAVTDRFTRLDVFSLVRRVERHGLPYLGEACCA